MRKKVVNPRCGEWAGRSGATSPQQTTAFTGTKRVLATDEQAASPSESHLRQPDERDESADQQRTAPRRVMKQAHDDVQNGQQDTDARNRVAEVLPDVPKTPQNFDEIDAVDRAPRVQKKASAKRG